VISLIFNAFVPVVSKFPGSVAITFFSVGLQIIFVPLLAMIDAILCVNFFGRPVS
jgi:hypothetical protein